MTCPYKDTATCDGPNGNRWWVCPVHGARLTQGWTNLCRTRLNYFTAWNEKRGPGQKSAATEPEPSKPKKELGVGTELRDALDWLRFGGNCKNRSELVCVLNRRGVEWCRNHIPTIVQWLLDHAKKVDVIPSESDLALVVQTAVDVVAAKQGRVTTAIMEQRRVIANGVKGGISIGHQFGMTAKTYGPPRVRTLLYHVWPFAETNIWKWNVAQLLRRFDQFNGKKVVAVALDASSCSLDEVVAEFGRDDILFLEFLNDPRFREVVSLMKLWEQVESDDPDEITFYAQSKGVTRSETDEVIRHWTDIMYATCLDCQSLVDDMLLRHQTVGTFKKVGRCFSGKSLWHFSGTFYWVRNAEVFSRPWRQCDLQWFGAESWPSYVFHEQEAGALLLTGGVADMDLYLQEFMEQTVIPAYEKWCADVLRV